MTKPPLPLTRQTRLVASRDQVSTTVGREAVILAMTEGVYYGLDGSGARIWSLFQTSRTLGEVHDDVVAEFDVEAGRAWTDLCVLADELIARGLLEQSPGPAS